ncbi:hypothetical protein [Ramlibacter sp.]|uniref:hypothetical protein n=1 Tax=Ramlibacter sp. TaxID=1917967 RepID=UPI002D37E949|nr:hypothetical protein [Ramlibacter sp.]HYD77543.1 hypothetical protein [Ramlibacter sp.]
MNLLRRLLAWIGQLLSPKAEPLQARRWDPQTNPVDVQKISRELRLKEEGRRLGAAGVPADSDASLCSPEEKAVAVIEHARTDYLAWGQLRLKSLQGELDRLDIRKDLRAAADGANEFERLAEAAITANAPELQQLGATATARADEFARFQAEHRRKDLPHYPVGLMKVLAWVFAVFLIAIEALLNASFFAKGLSGGLIDGFVEAAIASMLNVLVCLAVGALAIRHINHVHPFGKLYGMLGLLFAVCFITALGLAVSHYREALVLALDDPQSAAIKNVLADPFGLKQVSSWYLFCISVVFGILAVADGYKLDDRYPGYGKRHRQLAEAQNEYTGAVAQLQEHLEELKADALTKLDRALAQSHVSIASYKSAITDKERCRKDLNNLIFDAEPILKALLSEFRTENKVARAEKGLGVPPSFSTSPQLKDRADDVPDFSTDDDEKNLAEQVRALQEFVDMEPQIRGRIQAAYNARFSSLSTLFGHLDGTDLSSRITRSEQLTSEPSVEVALGGS